jgi:anti-sigma B factor antagonist
MSLSISERQSGPVTLLALNGRLMLGKGCGALNEKFERLIAEGRVRLLVECSQVTALDSQGISALVRGLIFSRKRGGDLKLLKPSPEVCRVLKLVRLLDVIELFDDEGAAVAGF